MARLWPAVPNHPYLRRTEGRHMTIIINDWKIYRQPMLCCRI
jgi:hypothetical protein